MNSLFDRKFEDRQNGELLSLRAQKDYSLTALNDALMGSVGTNTKQCVFAGRIKVVHCEFDPHYAYICTRPLKDMPWGFRTYGNSATDTGVFHEHIFFGKKVRIPSLGDKEWANIGFGPDGLCEEPNGDGYLCEKKQYISDRMADSVNFVVRTSTISFRDGSTYEVGSSNCQYFVSTVLEAYNLPYRVK
jgi:hypothetical protein